MEKLTIELRNELPTLGYGATILHAIQRGDEIHVTDTGRLRHSPGITPEKGDLLAIYCSGDFSIGFADGRHLSDSEKESVARAFQKVGYAVEEIF